MPCLTTVTCTRLNQFNTSNSLLLSNVMTTPRQKNYTSLIGIDISRNKLDFAIMHGKNFLSHRQIKNDQNEITAIIIEIKALPKFITTKAIFSMEQTGIYGNYLLRFFLHTENILS